jgi:alpha-mannosidase
MMEQRILHMIGNSHLDPVWLWQWQEGFQETKATFRSVLDRMKETDEFLYTSSSAAMYEWIENNDKEMFQEIKERIQEGRWEIVGGWWVQPDCNIPSGEAFARQGLYGQRYFMEKFGVIAKTAYNVDSFGHSGSLPQILKKSGMDYYVMMRPMSHEKGLPACLFQWESDDGSRVLTFRILYEYLSWGKKLDYHIDRCGQEINSNLPEIMCFYGVGNHGGGPTKENIESIKRNAEEKSDYMVIFSTPNRYFNSVSKNQSIYSVVHGELLHHAAGCYAAHSIVKKLNRIAENRLIAAEMFSTLADIYSSQKYPDNFNRAWKNVLFNQFHDILAGTSIETAYEDSRNSQGEAIHIADTNMNYAVQSISWKIGIKQDEDMKPLVVFNPHGIAVETNIEVELYGNKETGYTLLDSKDQVINYQIIDSLTNCNGRCRVSFVADLPALGYQTFRLYKKSAIMEKKISATDTRMENNRFILEFDEDTGYISKYYDKVNHVDILSAKGAVPIVIEDKSDTWSHDVTRFDKQIGTFKAESIRLVECGPVKATIKVISTYGNSRLIQCFSMYADLDKIDVNVKIIWNDMQKMLKLAFPVNTMFNKYCYETAFGYVERGNTGEEYPGQEWFDATGVTAPQGFIYGLGIMNDSKYSYSINVNTMMLTLLRSPVYAHHMPKELEEGMDYSVIDQGVQEMKYSLYPHKGKWEESQLEAYSHLLNRPPVTIIETFHDGPFPQENSFIEISEKNIVLTAMKKAEASEDIILRLYEAHKIKTDVKIILNLLDREFSLTFTPNEIKTILVPRDKEKPIREVNLLEFDSSGTN